MPITKIETIEVYDAQTGAITTREIEVLVPTDEELIAEKEAEMLRVYEEIQRLKNGN